jgi:hypothetical protein
MLAFLVKENVISIEQGGLRAAGRKRNLIRPAIHGTLYTVGRSRFLLVPRSK